MSLTAQTPAEGGRRLRALPKRPLMSLPFVALIIVGLAIAGHGAIIPAKAALAQVLLDRAFARSQSSHTPVKAWPWADNAPVARITVPRLKVSEIVLSGGSGEALAFGPTLMPGSAHPGQRGTSVFAAHRDTHFRFLQHLEPGDVVLVETLDRARSAYRVQGGYVVRNDRFGIDAHALTPTLALTTCWPFDAHQRGPLRYVVTARRVA